MNLAFEDFTLSKAGCQDEYPAVWLMYGGDEPTPTASTVNDTSRKPDSVVKVNGRPIPLLRDAALTLFKQRLDAVRITPIGDWPCYDCYLDRVTATLTGVFFAATRGEHQFSGYGHLGCCHLLAIQRVSEVSFERTAIPMGGSFKCMETRRELSEAEAQRLQALEPFCKGITQEQCVEQEFKQVAATAALFGDSIGAVERAPGDGEVSGKSSKSAWETTDKLKTYALSIESDDPLSETSKATGGTITRTVCTTVAPPLPMTAIANCRELKSEFHVHRGKAEKIASQVSGGKEKWRIGPPESAAAEAMKQAAKTWGIALDQEMPVTKCEPPIDYNGEQLTSCGWSDKAGMEALYVQITRFGYLRNGKGWDSIPWILTGGSGTVCKVEN